ncbi:MAG: copper oxidase, partial [Dechloromonas sp.]|nr:copper oxidase [Dechloromonas sp.]
GMFSVVKVREGISANDYADPGWYEHPEGTVSYEWTGDVPAPAKADGTETMTPSPNHGAHGQKG